MIPLLKTVLVIMPVLLSLQGLEGKLFTPVALTIVFALSGSLVLGLACARGWASPESIWNVSQLDESWQAEQWGADEEADAQTALKRAAFLHASEFYRLSRA